MKKFLIILLLVSFYSCKGKSYKVWKVSNDTSDNITLSFKDVSTSEYKQLDLPPSTIVTLKEKDIRQIITPNKDPSSHFSTFLITNTSGDTCTKFYDTMNNWTETNEKTTKPRRTYINYIFSVSDSDF